MSSEQYIPFDELVSQITESRAFLGETAEMMSGEMRQQFDTLLGLADEHFEKFKTEVPNCLRTVKQHAEELIQQNEQNVVDLAAAKEELEKVKQKVANGESPIPPAPPVKPVAPQLGSFLRDELLNKFSPQEQESTSVEDVAWRDWNLDGNWLAPDANQPS